MKNKLIFLALLLFPVSVFAELEFFLSNQNASFDSDSWSSEIYPDGGSEYIGIKFTPNLTPVPNEYLVVDTLVQELFTNISTQSTSVESEVIEVKQYQTDLYETLISTEHPQFIEHIIISINPETEIIIEEKIEQNIVLTPFEQTFYNCNIPIEEREKIVIDVLERIDSGEIESLETITYSNPIFGDCIIPFPDLTRRESIIENSFQSNQLTAQKKLNEETIYEVHESIESIVNQDSEYQKSFIESETYFSELFERSVISSDQYSVNEKIQSYYEKIVGNPNITYNQSRQISQEYTTIADSVMYFGKLLDQNRISSEQYSLYLQEINKVIELQKYFFSLFESGEIKFDQYSMYILEGQVYVENKKNITESYINNEIKKFEYVKRITESLELFEERYKIFSQHFPEINSEITQQGILPYWLIGIVVLLFIFLASILLFLKADKKILGKK